MNVRVKYYLWLAQKADITEDLFTLPEKASIKDLLREIARTRPRLKEVIERVFDGKNELVVLLNSKHPPKGLDTPLSNNDVVELLPPVSGGYN